MDHQEVVKPQQSMPIKVEAKAIKQKTYNYELLSKNIVHQVPLPLDHEGQESHETYVTRGEFTFFHYGCDSVNDNGWGCAYRSLQSMASWIIGKRQCQSELHVPSIREIQDCLVRIEDKPARFVGSRDWIGAMEVFYVVDNLYDVPCKILHILKSEDLSQHVDTLISYFKDFGGFAMMGGDMDAASKGIAGIHRTGSGNIYLLVVVG